MEERAAGVNIRGRFIIDPDGVIQAMEVLTPPVGRRVSETLRQIKALQHMRETGGKEVTPSGWEPGKKVLKPGPRRRLCGSCAGDILGRPCMQAAITPQPEEVAEWIPHRAPVVAAA